MQVQALVEKVRSDEETSSTDEDTSLMSSSCEDCFRKDDYENLISLIERTEESIANVIQDVGSTREELNDLNQELNQDLEDLQDLLNSEDEEVSEAWAKKK